MKDVKMTQTETGTEKRNTPKYKRNNRNGKMAQKRQIVPNKEILWKRAQKKNGHGHKKPKRNCNLQKLQKFTQKTENKAQTPKNEPSKSFLQYF